MPFPTSLFMNGGWISFHKSNSRPRFSFRCNRLKNQKSHKIKICHFDITLYTPNFNKFISGLLDETLARFRCPLTENKTSFHKIKFTPTLRVDCGPPNGKILIRFLQTIVNYFRNIP